MVDDVKVFPLRPHLMGIFFLAICLDGIRREPEQFPANRDRFLHQPQFPCIWRIRHLVGRRGIRIINVEGVDDDGIRFPIRARIPAHAQNICTATEERGQCAAHEALFDAASDTNSWCCRVLPGHCVAADVWGPGPRILQGFQGIENADIAMLDIPFDMIDKHGKPSFFAILLYQFCFVVCKEWENEHGRNRRHRAKRLPSSRNGKGSVVNSIVPGCRHRRRGLPFPLCWMPRRSGWFCAEPPSGPNHEV